MVQHLGPARRKILSYSSGRESSSIVSAASLDSSHGDLGTEEPAVHSGNPGSSGRLDRLIPNLDQIFHNVFSQSKPKSFDLGNYPKGHTRTVTFLKPGIVFVFVHCHLHPNMAVAIVASPNQWSTRADSTGRFTLSGAPSGSYTIVAWHKSAGFFRQAVHVTANRTATVQFVIPINVAGIASAVARK